jgi:Mrp family chromosome partitioning ATPase
MSRLFEALKQIQANLPPTPGSLPPVLPEDIEVAVPVPLTEEAETPDPPQAAEPGEALEPIETVEQVGPSEPLETDDSTEEAEETVAEEVVAEEIVTEEADDEEPDRDVVCLLSPLTERHKEQYRSLADNIVAQLPPGQPAVLLFTSVGQSEPKTGTLASLSVVLAEKLNDEIVAVDANFRDPCLASHFGIWAEQGLVDVLAGEANWRDVVRPTSVKRLSVLPGGRFSTDAGLLPGDVALSPVLDALRLHYRMVLVDAASLAYPEAAPVGRLCEGTYLVAELGHTPRGAAQRAVRVLERCGGRVLGCLLTGEPMPR